ncbi:DUF6210 family protein [Sorangium sp. So ce291]|uniref:DUF6210 family protein n=1 Tax=Sorangium sp. So ce291 TaxID=3133294 RepID=UPI003F5F924F
MNEKWSMIMKRVLLWDIPDEIMLVVEHPSGVVYQNQVGGVVCWQAEMEGVLSPLDVSAGAAQRIQDCPYLSGREGITAEVADAIDALLASEPGARFLKVDRARLGQSWEAWVYVLIDSPESSATDAAGVYHGPIYGFGGARGVLTWPNSD